MLADTPDDVARLLDVLRRHGGDVGRDTSEIRVTTLHHGGSLGRDLDSFVAEMAEMAERVDMTKVGVETIYVMAPGDRPAEWIETVVVPAVDRLAELPTGGPTPCRAGT